MTLKEAVPVNPFEGETLTLYVVPFPGATFREDGVADIEKLGGLGVIWTKFAIEGTPAEFTRNSM